MKGESLLIEAYVSMVNRLPDIFTGKDEPQLVIGFDEANHLGETCDRGFRPSHILCESIRTYSRKGKASVWVAFASTTSKSKVADVSAPQPIGKHLLDISIWHY